ncbi:MAG: hypothetical protein HJJLKODD_00802 [Phycisphaerae bacterium]|nr:hypothetical protein [Phycisphaerae bacterium]
MKLKVNQSNDPVPSLRVVRQKRQDLKLLIHFIQIYCAEQHGCEAREAVMLRGFDLAQLYGAEPVLCRECQLLLAHAISKRRSCPYDPKPACKHCPTHCYQPNYRQRIREVMRYSGRRLVLSGRLDYLWKRWF